MKTTEEKNRMIAEFMEVLQYRPCGDYIERFCDPYEIEDAQYHKSWDWLMPVVVHINSTTDYTFVIQAMDCYVYNVNSGEQVTQPSMKHQPDELINSVYETLIQFIEWYNENK